MNISNLGRRALVALFGIPLIVSCLYLGGWFLVALVLIINSVSQFEFYKLAKLKAAHPIQIPAMIIGFFIPILFYLKGLPSLAPYLALTFVILFIFELFRTRPNALLNVATTVMGIIYPVVFFSFFILIREFPKTADIPYVNGGLFIIAFVVIIWICDTAAYFVGRMIGKHKLYYRISPNKTIEGAIAGFIGAILTALLFFWLFPEVVTLKQALILGAGLGIFSQLGDLVESAFKRDAGVKDSSAILPGHGGFLDRFDAPIISAPLIYFCLTLFH
ncbi:phosphatidate cytidylyltransferase [candidate division KSB1 bacterium]|nr:phosphatidate cytidylyltransferase [candidate division KSB1 bacterium]